MIMKELFIPYPLAVVAYNKGFKEFCLGWYRQPNNYDTIFLGEKEGDLCISKVEEGQFIAKGVRAPIYQQIVDFLVSKGIDIHYQHRPTDGHKLLEQAEHRFMLFQLKDGKNKWIEDFHVITTDKYFGYNKAIEEAFKLIT